MRLSLATALLVAVLQTSACGCGTQTFSVNHNEEFLIVAQYERQLNAITETLRGVVGYEVTTSRADGTFEIRGVPMSLNPFSGKAVTYITISRPGFAVFSGKSDEQKSLYGPESSSDGEGHFTLQAIENYQEARRNYWAFLRETGSLRSALKPEEQAQIDRQSAEWESWLRQNYAAELAVEEHRREQRSFKVVFPSWRYLYGKGVFLRKLCLLDDGRIAVLQESNDYTFQLVLLDKSLGTVATLELGSTAEGTAMTSSRQRGVTVLANSGLTEVAPDGTKGMSLALQPPLPAGLRVFSIAWVPDGLLMALMDSTGSTSLRLYHEDGTLAAQRATPEIRQVWGLGAAPDGALLVHADMVASSANQEMLVVGRKKERWLPRVLLHFDSLDSQPRKLFEGADTVQFAKDGIWAYAGDLYKPEDESVINLGVNELTIQILLHLSWSGEILEARDVSDGFVRDQEFQFAQSTEAPRLLYVVNSSHTTGAEVVELLPDAGTPAWSPR